MASSPIVLVYQKQKNNGLLQKEDVNTNKSKK